MSNESLIAIPPDVTDPILLRRTLSHIVEQLDVVLGNRASGANTYVDQAQLVTSAEEIASLLQSATDALQSALDDLEEVSEGGLAELEDRVEVLENTAGLLQGQIDNIKNAMVIKGAMLSFTVDGLGDPVINLNYNIDTVVHTSTGVYTVNIDELDFEGYDVLENSVATIAWVIAPDTLSEVFTVTVTLTATPGEFVLTIKEQIVGAGSKLEWVLYDLAVDDIVEASLLMTLPGATVATGF